MKRIMSILFVITVMASILATGGKISYAAVQGEDAGISSKLDKVIENQQSILKDIADIKAELAIIKIRVTQQQ